MLLAEHRYVSSMVILNDDHLRTCTALVIRHSRGILMCVVYFILSWTISVPLCLMVGKILGKFFMLGLVVELVIELWVGALGPPFQTGSRNL